MPIIGQFDFDGSCAPGRFGYLGANQHYFSVGIFQWVKSKTVKIKRSAVICRVKGTVAKRDLVYAFAKQLCNDLNAGVRRPEDLQKTYQVGNQDNHD
jgi:hypothetical protein